MSTDIMLTIMGISFTIILGLLAIIIAIRFNKKVKLTFMVDQCISLLEDITKNIPELKISYKNETIKKNILLLKGYLINTGKKDISPNMVEKKITLNLPKGFEWIDCEITNKHGLNVKILKINKNNIIFDFGLWKVKEYFKFDALAKVVSIAEDEISSPNIQLLNNITFSHRIADMEKIEKEKIPSKKKPNSKNPLFYDVLKRSIIPFSIIFLIFGIIFLIFSFLQISKEMVIGFDINDDGINYKLYPIIVRDNIKLTNYERYEKIYNVDEFNNLEKKIILLPERGFLAFFSIQNIGIIYIIIAIILFLLKYIDRVREKRILELINK